mmetsp:Transcript_25886/g.54656  ORF Transcript_25886/g.54656 Transcript_25886/m.54656 type:complete len:343 (-) Transcript_25886:389-1417(-)
MPPRGVMGCVLAFLCSIDLPNAVPEEARTGQRKSRRRSGTTFAGLRLAHWSPSRGGGEAPLGEARPEARPAAGPGKDLQGGGEAPLGEAAPEARPAAGLGEEVRPAAAAAPRSSLPLTPPARARTRPSRRGCPKESHSSKRLSTAISSSMSSLLSAKKLRAPSLPPHCPLLAEATGAGVVADGACSGDWGPCVATDLGVAAASAAGVHGVAACSGDCGTFPAVPAVGVWGRTERGVCKPCGSLHREGGGAVEVDTCCRLPAASQARKEPRPICERYWALSGERLRRAGSISFTTRHKSDGRRPATASTPLLHSVSAPPAAAREKLEPWLGWFSVSGPLLGST